MAVTNPGKILYLGFKWELYQKQFAWKVSTENPKNHTGRVFVRLHKYILTFSHSGLNRLLQK